jgi:hypothetical protein
MTVKDTGKHQIVIAAKDNDNAVTQQEFELNIALTTQQAAQQ